MPPLYLLEPDPQTAWLPFQHSRPVAELRAGVWLVRERWEAIAGGETAAIFGPPHLHRFSEAGVPPVEALRTVEGPALIGHSTFAPTGVPPDLPGRPAALVNDGAVAGWWVPAGHTWTGPADGGSETELDGLMLHGAYDLLTALDHFLVPDAADFTRESTDRIPDGCIVIGDPHDVVLLGGVVEPGVTFDVRAGAVVLEQETYVKGGTRLEGPVYVGPGTQVLGGVIGWCAVGPQCKVHGELTHTVFLGQANKVHDGFVGHSVIGRWANLGAGTITSNLKNTYGSVRLEVDGERLETGRQFLGSLVGDHAKTAIGTLLSTGTVIGAGANVFGAAPPAKAVRPFAWGAAGERMTLEGFLRIAERVLPRRGVEVTDPIRAALTALYEHAAGT